VSAFDKAKVVAVATYFMLEGRKVVEAPSLERWSAWFFSANREVASDEVSRGLVVSTTFLGRSQHDHSEGPPLLFETKTVDRHGAEHYSAEYATWDEAARGHADEVRRRRVQRDYVRWT
jgi:hypothetical protein